MKYRLNLWSVMLGVALLFLPAIHFAQAVTADPAPVIMLKQATGAMLEALRANHADMRHNQQALYKVINEIIIPHVDKDSMAQQVVGPKYWESASNFDRESFIQAFEKVVIRTYSAAMVSYSDQQIIFLPLRESIDGKSRLDVYSRILQNNGQPIELRYRLALRGEEWKVQDFSVDGVSLVQNYRSQFSDVLAQKGFSGLLDELSKRNQQSGM